MKKAKGISPSETLEEILAKIRECEEINLKDDEEKKWKRKKILQ